MGLSHTDLSKLLKFSGKDLQSLTMSQWLAQKPEALRSPAATWFQAIMDCGPDVQGIFHDDYPIGCVEEAPFAYVNVYQAHLNIGFFYGVDLPDPLGLLEGKGKKMRHIKIRPGESCEKEGISILLMHAYCDIKEKLVLHEPNV